MYDFPQQTASGNQEHLWSVRFLCGSPFSTEFGPRIDVLDMACKIYVMCVLFACRRKIQLSTFLCNASTHEKYGFIVSVQPADNRFNLVWMTTWRSGGWKPELGLLPRSDVVLMLSLPSLFGPCGSKGTPTFFQNRRSQCNALQLASKILDEMQTWNIVGLDRWESKPAAEANWCRCHSRVCIIELCDIVA